MLVAARGREAPPARRGWANPVRAPNAAGIFQQPWAITTGCPQRRAGHLKQVAQPRFPRLVLIVHC